LSRGDHPPTESRCQTWAGIRIDEGHFDSEDLSGIKVGLMMDLPGHHVAWQLDGRAVCR
jgi:hypothetical protein